ncbi:MAG: MazG nucleotide pyrophosphohydrolase domain-containing protein [Candidatus Pacearchaeota archaeon]
MEIKDAQDKIDKEIKELGGYWEPLSMFARLVEEVGELGRELNLIYGGKKKKSEDDGKGLKEEFGDMVFTLFALAKGLGINLDEALNEKMEKNHKRDRQIYK